MAKKKLNFIRPYLQSDFIKNVITLTTGTILAQGIALLISPVLSRLFTPEEFGDIVLYLSIAGAFAIIATARYEKAIVVASNNNEAKTLLWLSHFVSFAVAILNVIMVFVFIYFFSKWVNMSATFRFWLYLMPLFTLLFGSSQAFTNWFIRKKSFKTIAVSKIINSIGINFGIAILGFAGLGLAGLFLGNFLGLFFFSLYLFCYYYFKPEKTGSLHSCSYKETGKKYKDFPYINSPQALVEMFQINGIIYLLGIFFTSEVLGLYSFSMKVLMAPMWIFGTSISQVFYQKASEIYNNGGSLKFLFRKTALNGALLSFPIMIILIIFGPQLFAFVFGEEWYKAGVYARILAPWIFLDFLKAPLSQIPLITGRIKSMFFIALIGNAILIASMIFGGAILNDEKIAFGILSVSMCIYIIGLLTWIYHISEKKAENQLSINAVNQNVTDKGKS